MSKRSLVFCFFTLCFLVTGCVSAPYYPDKEREGNVEVVVEPLIEGEIALHPRVYLDNNFIGHASPQKPILYLKRGMYTFRVKLDRYEIWEERIRVLGAPTMQKIHVKLEKKEDKPITTR